VMSQKNEIVSIRINIKEGFIETKSRDGSGIRQSFQTGEALQLTPFGKDGMGATRKAVAASQSEAEAPSTEVDAIPQLDQPGEAVPARKEKSPATVLSGRLKNKPSEGRPDGHGKPTAVSPFLTHQEGADGAVLVYATFHNHTREIALNLSESDQI